MQYSTDRMLLWLMHSARMSGQADEARHEADVREWYTHGDGASPRYMQDPDGGGAVNVGGRGYTYPECVHGTSRWTDWDNICGGCEEGASLADIYIGQVRHAFRQFQERNLAVKDLRDSGYNSTEQLRPLYEWSFEPIDGWITRIGEEREARKQRMARYAAAMA